MTVDDLKRKAIQIAQKVAEVLKKVGLEIYYFLSSKIFLKNFGIAIGSLVIILIMTFWLLKSYTHHGESITVPDFTGMTLDKVERLTKSKHLRYYVLDSLYSPTEEALSVLAQEPIAGSKVKENRKIYLTVNATMPPLVNVPDIWGSHLEFAKRMLEASGLGIDEEILYEKDPAENTVLKVQFDGKELKRPNKQRKEAAHRIPKGSLLKLTIAEGRGNEVAVPRVICRTVEEAIFLLSNSGLNVGVVLPDISVGSDTLAAYIYRQRPDYDTGELMRMGEQVDIWITRDKPLSCPEDWDYDF